jgi:uncharacterized membrane protein
MAARRDVAHLCPINADQKNGGGMETRLRSILKALIWQVIGLSVMTVVGVLVTGSATAGGLIAAINTAIGFFAYFCYERVWSRIRWGRSHA